jgi:hypothetical protein
VLALSDQALARLLISATRHPTVKRRKFLLRKFARKADSARHVRYYQRLKQGRIKLSGRGRSTGTGDCCARAASGHAAAAPPTSVMNWRRFRLCMGDFLPYALSSPSADPCARSPASLSVPIYFFISGHSPWSSGRHASSAGMVASCL